MSTANSAGVRCARCHRALKHPQFLGAVPYGSICIKKIAPTDEPDIIVVKPAPHDVTEVVS